MTRSAFRRPARKFALAIVALVAVSAACGGGTPSSPTPTTTTTTPPPTTAAPQVLTDARLTAIISRSSELSFSAINDAVDRAGISIALGAAPLAFSDIVLKHTTERKAWVCPGGGVATVDLTVTGVMGTKADNAQISERQTFLTCSVTLDDGQTVTVSGTLTGLGSYGKTPTGEQSLRWTGSFTYVLEPSNTTARCEADLSVNYLNLKDPRARATGTACGRAVAGGLLPAVTPVFPQGTRGTPPSLVPGVAPDYGLYRGTYNYLPSRCGTFLAASWAAIFHVDGAFVDVTYTAFFFEGEVLNLRVPLTSRQIHFQVPSVLLITFDGTFSEDWQSIDGTFITTPCVTGGDRVEGRWSGMRQ